MADQISDEPRTPRLRAVRLSALQALAPCGIVDDDADLDGVTISGVRADELVWSGRRQLRSSELSDLVATTWRARGAGLVECRLDRLDVVSLLAADSQWRNVELRQSRIGSAELYDTVWDGVEFTRCKLGFVNLRGAQLRDVCFTDCIIEELDLQRVTASRVALPGCRIGRLDLAGANLADVDLRTAELADVAAVEGLRGATITFQQLLDMAPILAGRLGIRVA